MMQGIGKKPWLSWLFVCLLLGNICKYNLACNELFKRSLLCAAF